MQTILVKKKGGGGASYCIIESCTVISSHKNVDIECSNKEDVDTMQYGSGLAYPNEEESSQLPRNSKGLRWILPRIAKECLSYL